MPHPMQEKWQFAADRVSMLQLLVYLSTTLPRCIGNSTQRGGWDAANERTQDLLNCDQVQLRKEKAVIGLRLTRFQKEVIIVYL